MSNYPDGAANDPNAPWNYDESKWTEWEQFDNCPMLCKKCGEERMVDENRICEDCFEPEEIEKDYSRDDD